MIKETMTAMERFQTAVRLGKSDRTPVCIGMDYKFPCRYKGITMGAHYRDMRVGYQALKEVFDELGGWDFMMRFSMTTQTLDLLNAPMVIKIPGKDIGEDDIIQWDEKEILKREDYDRIIEMGWKQFMYEFYPKFKGWNVSEYHERVAGQAKKEIEAMKEDRKYWQQKGVPVIGESLPFSSIMMFSCARSLMEFTKDIYNIPDKVAAAMDATVPDLIELSIKATKDLEIDPDEHITGSLIVLERGGSFYYPPKIFERFEWPYLKQMVEAFVAEGITPVMHFDQDWSLNLPYLKQLPKGKCIAQFDHTTDIFKA
ncbi:MAG: hypothetical protein JRH15_05105, partial [Deltaproteobacteria bacterium]|nr:hypothetical protein [Deltaproteobacteria bacterium]